MRGLPREESLHRGVDRVKEGKRGKQRTSGGVAEWSGVGGMLLIPPRNGTSRRAAKVGVAVSRRGGGFFPPLLLTAAHLPKRGARDRTDRPKRRPKPDFTNSKASHTNIVTNIKTGYTNSITEKKRNVP